MEARLKDSIEGCCGGLDRRVDDVEPKTEARLISLEMARTEVETGHTDLEEQFEGLCLELGHLNQLMERESLANQSKKSGIFIDPPAGATVGGTSTSRTDPSNQDREHGLNFPNSCIPGSGMSHLGASHRSTESSELSRGRPS
jgi:hypothetical protein